jgi:hypothetical protein
MSVRITCINKDGGNHYNPHVGVTHYGWVNESTGASDRSTRQQMIKFLEEDKGTAYVKDGQGNTAHIGVWPSAAGNKYLRTYADGKWTDNLLALPEC